MVGTAEDLPDDVAALRAALVDATTRALHVEAELAIARARASDDQALIAHQKLHILKLRRALYGQRSERGARLLDQMELGFEELQSTAAEDELAAVRAAARTTNVAASSAVARRVSPSRSTCRASAWWSPRPPPARAAAVAGSADWARTSPRRWR